MTSLQDINMRQLIRTGLGQPGPRQAIEYFERQRHRPEKIATLLRNHEDEGVDSPTEIRRRGEADDLLTLASKLEVACIAGVMPRQPTDPSLQRIREFLVHKSVQPFYLQYYPLLLPWLLCSRLADRWDTVEPNLASASALFERFSALTDAVERDSDVEMFLDMLDDFEYAGIRDADLHELIMDFPRLLLIAARRPARGRGRPLDRAARGFLKYTQFSKELLRLLRDAEACTLLRSAMWLHHAYWIRELRRDILGAIGAFTKGVTRSIQGAEMADHERRLALAHVAEIRSTFEQLCDARQWDALERLVPRPSRSRGH